MAILRRFLLELWAMFIAACVVGFIGPFGTYLEGDLVYRIGRWASFLAGAYVVVRPAISAGHVLAQRTMLPQVHILVWLVVLSAFPLSLLWTWSSSAMFNSTISYAVMLPFSLICAVAVLVVVWWADRIDERYRLGHPDAVPGAHAPDADSAGGPGGDPVEGEVAQPRLFSRLSPGFGGPVLALQGEDHYVRVHASDHAELVLMRLRDAIAEMDGAEGEQVHRSWWVARDAVAGEERRGRIVQARLRNGILVPVARDSVERLRAAGYLPG